MSISTFVDKDHESELNQLENTYTSVFFMSEYVSSFFNKYVNKIKRQNAAVTKLGTSLNALHWFENEKGNLVFSEQWDSPKFVEFKSSKPNLELQQGNNLKTTLRNSDNWKVEWQEDSYIEEDPDSSEETPKKGNSFKENSGIKIKYAYFGHLFRQSNSCRQRYCPK